jgi:hypothetical protein
VKEVKKPVGLKNTDRKDEDGKEAQTPRGGANKTKI